jgi:signal transduction histidine kinase/DNA-binding response OmpR family regulator
VQSEIRRVYVTSLVIGAVLLAVMGTALYRPVEDWIVALAIGGTALVLLLAARGYRREALRRTNTESNFRDLVQALPVGVWRLRSDKQRGLRFEFVSDNTPLVRHVDQHMATQEYDNVFRSIHPDDRPRVWQAMQHTLRTLEPLDIEYRVPVGNAVHWLHSSARARREENGSVVLSGYWADVTRERALRDALSQARDEATRAMRAKSAFLAAMSHEIRTPMNGVLGLLELLSLTPLDTEQRSTLAVVRSSGQSLLRIVDDILDFSKMEAERLALDPAPASLHQLVESTCQVYSSHASGKGLLLTFSVDPAISPVLLFDRHRLGQVLNNLVSNALKFTERGSVTLRAQRVHGEGGWEQVRLTVTDTGIGVSEEEMDRLFQPFVQSAPDTSARFGGTGLGLVIARRLAELMGGSLTMHSEPGRGTTMTLVCSFPVADPGVLPADAAAGEQKALEALVSASRAAPEVPQAEAEGTLVLVVDDHPTNRMVLRRQLLSLGYAAETANDGRMGYEAWKTGRFALVIADCNMPVMTGAEMARAIRAHEAAHGLPRTPIFACSANAMPTEAGLCQEAGMDEYLVKPIGVAELGAQLGRWLPLPRAGGTRGVDPQLLRALTGGDLAVEAELLDEYRRTHESDAQVLRQAVADGDLRRAAQAAHRIRGACVALGSSPLADATSCLEEALAAGDPSGVQACMAAFDDELARLLAALAPHAPARRREASRT